MSEEISGERYHEEHEVKPHACAKCFMACGRLTKLRKGRHKDLKLEGPEYETIYSFGGLCMITDMAEIAYLNDLCDRLGMDTITAGNLCALVMEAKIKGRLDYQIEYGDADQVARLISKIATREDIGDILADGIIAASEQWGLTDLAIHVKGLEPAGYDPRVLKGMGLTFGTSPRGACHLRTTFYKPELSGMIPADQIKDKAAMLIDFENRLNIFDTLILCRFYRDLYPWAELSKAITLATGLPATQGVPGEDCHPNSRYDQAIQYPRGLAAGRRPSAAKATQGKASGRQVAYRSRNGSPAWRLLSSSRLEQSGSAARGGKRGDIKVEVGFNWGMNCFLVHRENWKKCRY